MQNVMKNEKGLPVAVDDEGFLLEGVLVKVNLSDVINDDLESFLDRISEKAGFPLLMQQSWKIEAHGEDVLVLRVWGDTSASTGE